MIFRTYESPSNYQQPFQIIHREFAQKIKYLNEQCKPLHPVLLAVGYHKVVIVGVSCDITRSIIINLLNRLLEIDLFLERGIILNAIFFKRGPNLETQAAHTQANHSQVTPGVSTECARSLRP